MYVDCGVCKQQKDCHQYPATLDDRVMCNDCSQAMQRNLATFIERHNRRFQAYAGAVRYGLYRDFPTGVEVK